ncbi:MAG TPA: 3-hydroxyacyl-CoA dehydrogenase NAD-binding domain-containing protein, partial [Gammaproteobacteria bacterium]|nr:3-hydroxyacyl-CoA dehydrogenase NAD-binding domain-containing protein [Gammaproteobacteria bacterium]
MGKYIIKKAAVLGAGVMGAQIAAFFVTAGIETLLFDLSGSKSDPNSIAAGAINALKKLQPSPLGLKEEVNLIQPANYDHDLEQLKSCDFVIEAISERLEWKLE